MAPAVVWTLDAELDLQRILEYHLGVSPPYTEHLLYNLLSAGAGIA